MVRVLGEPGLCGTIKGTTVAVVALDVLGGWAICRTMCSLKGYIWRGRKWERVKPCEIREWGTQGDCGKTEVKRVAHIVDRNNHGCGR
jgi:hypothetical protein